MISKEDIYTSFWKCRDLEIQMLWTRLTLLGAIMALTYTGYGVLLMKIVENAKLHWVSCNLLAMVICCCGMLFSCLWITTAKGSKRWYERYEAALSYFQEANRNSFERFDNGDLCLSYHDFKKPEIVGRCAEEDASLLTVCGGCFSVSKIPIVLGQLSLIGWSVVSGLHIAAIYLGKDCIKLLIENLGMQFGAFLILSSLLTISFLCQRVRSSF